MGMEITLAGVSRRFGERVALSGIDAVFPAGRVSAVIGPNGSGKSTLLRIMARLEKQDAGTVTYLKDGLPLPEDIDLMRRMTLVAQRPVLFNTTLRENIAYGIRARGIPSDEVCVRVDEALTAGGMTGLAEARATTLSGGESQRAALIRAYALRPDAVFLDEPTANMDPDNAALTESLITQLSEEAGTTVIMVTHNFFQARRLAGHVFFMFGGGLVESGPARKMFGSPEKELTAKYFSGEVIC